MKKIVFVLLAFSISLNAQEFVVDSLEIQNLEEVIVSSIRVKENIPIAFNNVFLISGLYHIMWRLILRVEQDLLLGSKSVNCLCG